MDYMNLYNQQQFQNFKLDIEKYVENGLSNKAVNMLQDALSQCSDHPGVYYLMGQVYYKGSDYMKALQYLKQAVYFDNSNDEYLALLASCYYELQDFDNAYNNAMASYEINNSNLDCIIVLGKLELSRGNYNDAIGYAKTSVNLDNNNFKALRLLSKCYIANGEDYNKIIDLLNHAKKLGNDEELDFDIVKVMYMNGKYEECLKECKKIMVKSPNSHSAQKARELVSKIKSRNSDNGSKTRNNQNNKLKDEVERQSASLEEALDKLNTLIGLEKVKNEIQRIVKLIQFEKNRAELLGIPNNINQSYHFMFLGNPGTGKTTVARLIGDIFYYLGILEKGHLVEADRSTIVGQFIGQTAQLTKEVIEKSMGGVLFIDEAYSLARGGTGSNDFGPEAIDTLIKAMEDSRGKFTVILAGYTKEMRELMKLNPGLKSRINLDIEFQDYGEDDLLKIAKSMAAANYYTLSPDGEKAFIEKINREKVDESFSNARTARNIVEAAIREKAFRIGGSIVSKEEMSTLEAIDFGIELSLSVTDQLDSLLKELDDMVGLENVKEVIKKVVNFVQFQYKKKEMGLPVEDISLNMIFVGNPGTGKTTVARIVSKIFKAIGVLKKGHMIEVTRDGLVGQYVGQTGPKTLDKIKEAYGGILFIDEAYSLVGSSENDFGKEAIATLIKEMEDNRDKLAVVMAGYTNEMKNLLNINPGLSSRIGYTVEFPDYKPDEMLQIFQGLCSKQNYVLSSDGLEKLKNVFSNLYSNRDKNFGNGRLVRKCFETIKMQQAQRVISNNMNGEDMFKITAEDIKPENLN